MGLLELASAGAVYILKGITGSKTFDKAKEETFEKFWKWTKNVLFKKNTNLEKKVIETPGDDKKKEILTQELLAMLQNEELRNEFQGWMGKLKNVFEGKINEVEGNVRIGDDLKEGSVRKGDAVTRKNIFTGEIGKIGGDFTLGDKEK